MIDLKEIPEKGALIKSIVMELSAVPDEYLQTLYAIIHSFRTHLPQGDTIISESKDSKETAFDWDSLINEINENRSLNNEKINERIDKLMW